jgi:hypothetical protein
MSRSPRLSGVVSLLRPLALAVCALLGAASASAAARHPALHLDPIPLRLDPPALPPAVLSGQRLELQLRPIYGGESPLTFAVDAGPDSMTIDATSGLLTWTPPAAAEGTEITASASVTDSVWTAHTSFTIVVARTTPMATSVSGSTITVTAPGNLQGFALALPAGASLPPAQIEVSTVSPGQAAPIPEGVTRISDFFRVTPVNGGPDFITLVLPTSHLPAGRSAQDVRLFVHSGAAENVGPDGEIEGQCWIRTWYAFDVLASGMASIKLHALGELAFIGIDAEAASASLPTATSTSSSIRVGGKAVSIACTASIFSSLITALDIRDCTITGDVALAVRVRHFSGLQANPAVTLNELLGWLVFARQAFTVFGLGADPGFEVVVEPMPEPFWWGFVTTEDLEDRRVLHITSAPWTKPIIQGTVVHEYFHHAQSRTKVAGLTNLIDTFHRGDWAIEGTAKWFEDELFDALDSYQQSEEQPLRQILGLGLAAMPVEPIRTTRAYSRFAFWKAVQSSCGGFSLPSILNCDTSADPACVANFKGKLESPSWQCDFGAGFGSANKATLAAALLFYTYATVKENDIALLDSNEPQFDFRQPNGWELLQSSANCTSFDHCPAGSKHSGLLPAAGAVPFVIAAVDPLSPGTAATVEVRSDDGGSVWVWVGDDELSGGLSRGSWSKTTTSWTSTYAWSGRAPKTMVVLVNPDPAKSVQYEVRAGIIRPTVASSDWSFPDRAIFWCYSWQGHTDVSVLAPAGLTATLHMVPNRSDMVELDITGAVAAFPVTIDITGNLAITAPATNGTRCNDLSGNAYQVMTYSNPTMRVNTTTIGAPVPFHLRKTFYQPYPGLGCQDSVSIAWDYLDEKYTAEGDLWLTGHGTDDRGALCVGYNIAKQ